MAVCFAYLPNMAVWQTCETRLLLFYIDVTTNL